MGELLLVAGLGILGFLVWQPWYTGFVIAGEQTEQAALDSSDWLEQAEPNHDGVTPVVSVPEDFETMGTLHVPAFGTTYANRIVGGTHYHEVLGRADRGIGVYEGSGMPGEPGNLSMAAHRGGPWGAPFREVENLRVGDPIFIETPEGWYTYRFRDIEYVTPDAVDVLNPFPRLEGEPGKDQVVTLTTCHPKWGGNAERAIAYGVLEGYQPLTDGPPAELLELNPNLEGVAS
ncbi:MAG: class E sortase [Leucobacter sp.]